MFTKIITRKQMITRLKYLQKIDIDLYLKEFHEGRRLKTKARLLKTNIIRCEELLYRLENRLRVTDIEVQRYFGDDSQLESVEENYA